MLRRSVKILISLILSLPILNGQATFRALNGATAASSCGGTYLHCNTITIPAQTSNLTDFTFTIDETHAYLATVANGGQIQNTVTQTGGGASITVPADFIVASDACVTKISFEWELYNATTGHIIIHAKITLSGSLSVIPYACYDAVSVTTFQGNVNGAWNANYGLVQHLTNGTTLSLTESTGNANVSTNNGATASAGKIDGGGSCTATYYAVTQSTSLNLNGAAATIEAWIKYTDGSTKYVVEKGVDNYYFLIVGAGTLQESYGTGQGPVTATSPLMYNDGAWHYFVSVFNATNSFLYVDGVLVATSPSVTSTLLSSSATNLGICATNTGGFAFTGFIDELRISNVARSAAWILSSYNSANSPSTFYTWGPEL